MRSVLAAILALSLGLFVAAAHSARLQTDTPDASGTGLLYDADTGVFTDAPPPEGGWQALADLLQRAAPSTNTGIPLTPAQVTDRIAALIDSGKPEAALQVVEQRRQARELELAIGTDVQLDYQHARALAALGRHAEARQRWRQMTIDYPELPEPWNALAIEYARVGSLEQAREALEMALVSDPGFAPALENLGHIQMRLAQESFARARAGHAGQRTQEAQ